MRTKQVSYAYPTSITAESLCKPDGCWLVECGEGEFMPCVSSRTAHDTERAAVDAAHVLPLPWSGIWLQTQTTREGIHIQSRSEDLVAS